MTSRKPRSLAARALPIAFLALLLSLLPACGESDATVIVKRPAAERPDIDHAAATQGALLVPQSQPFNLTSFTSGQVGKARGESIAVGKDAARCAAQAEDGGSSWAEFQLGYCFDNAANTPLDAAVKLKLRLTETKSIKSRDVDESTGKSALRFVIKDSIGQTLRSEELSTSSLLKGPQANATTHDIVFDARFEPDRGYYLLMIGRVEAQAAQTSTASIAMDVQQASLEIDWRPAPSAKAHASVQE